MTAPTTLSCIYEDDVVSIDVPTEDFLEARFALFDGKIDMFINHPQYPRIRFIADRIKEECYSDYPIVSHLCEYFVSTIEKSNFATIEEFLDNFDNEEE